MKKAKVTFHTETLDGLKIFYRKAGDPAALPIVLLHGFPTSSHMFRNLIPELSNDYYVIAPDYPGFGFSDAPEHSAFNYTFDNIGRIMGDFIDKLGLKRFAIYIFDYGAPVGLRIALRFPERIAAIISQNGNAYNEGFGKEFWAPIRKYWENPTQENRYALKDGLTYDGVRFQYHNGVENAEQRIAPEAIMLDVAFLARPQSTEIQLDLVGDYKNNVQLYPKFHQYFRAKTPPMLCAWGKNDSFFIPRGAEAYKRDLPDARVVFFDTGHFALETHAAEIGAEIRLFLQDKE